MDYNPRLKRELKTIAAMVQIYCRNHHTTGDDDIVCQDCSEFLHYAEKKLNRCPFQQSKPTCANCTIHCYKNLMRDKARKIMRYSGPKMIRHHPILAISHLLDSRKKPERASSADNAVNCRDTKHKKQ
jgi:hypothetical protein